VTQSAQSPYAFYAAREAFEKRILTLKSPSQPDPTTIFSPSATPAYVYVGSGPVEMGVKFRSDLDGTIAGIRFYKAPDDTGSHTGSLWSSTGTLLATGTFSGETASGWQQLNFSTPVAIAANTTYVASYHSGGSYEFSLYDFLYTGVDNPPLHALKDGADGPNGLYVYGPGGIFPTQTYLSSNYWVDVVFAAGALAGTPQAITALSGTPQSAAVRTSFALPLQAKVTDTSSNPLANVSVTFTAPASGPSASFSGSSTASAITNAAGIATSPSPIANANSGTYTVTASTPGLPPASFTLTNSPALAATTIFSPSATPAYVYVGSSPVEMGVKFRSDLNGTIAGIRFYKVLGDTGSHTGSLWSSTGTLLATGSFSGETASGWQQLNFSTPVAIAANTTYVASYHSGGSYGFSLYDFLYTGVDNPPLHALKDGADGPNGLYVYGPGGIFPTQTYWSSNYWVDVVFGINGPATGPVVSAGANQTITLLSSATLSGSVADPCLPNCTLTTTWSVASGPGTVTFANPAALSTTATFSTAGTYVLQLTATDGMLSASSTITVTVNSAPVSCGASISGTVTLTANVTSSVGITRVQFELDGSNLGPPLTTIPYSFSWLTTTVANGCHLLTAVAQDVNGQTGTTAMNVAVNNP
jgi:hypothetical protein